MKSENTINMKVLHLPVNIASQPSVTVRALKDIGVDARGIVFGNTTIQDGTGIKTFTIVSRRKHPIRGILQTLPLWREVINAIRWADVIHWHYSARALPFDLDLKYVAQLNKARIVEFWGTDIRIPEIASADNPYRAKMYLMHPQLAKKGYQNSLKTQKRFARYGFECLIPGYELLPYIQKELFPRPFMTRQRIILSDFVPLYPDPSMHQPLIIHVPSHKAKKGTEAVMDSIETLKNKYRFNFKLIHNVSRTEALENIRKCDIMLDQFVAGEYGLASLEAMAFGKPTFCYIKPSLISQLPKELPIVNANQDNLSEVIEEFLADGQKRHDIGVKSRAYVEKYHDAHKIAHQLVGIYKELLSQKKRK